MMLLMFIHHLENVCLPKNSVLQLIHRVEFFQSLFQNHVLTFNHDLPERSHTKNDFPIALCITNHLLNLQPETLLILVKHAISEQGISKDY